MGKLNKEVQFINDTIANRQEMDFSSYNKFLETTPIFVTYYKQDSVESTTDMGFQNVESFTGDDSPIKYNKIKNVPLYNVDMTQLELNEDETGLKPGFNSSGTMLPQTIVPVPNDYMTIDYMDKSLLFKILDVSSDTIKSNHYYKIEFKFNKVHGGSIESNVTDNYTLVYDNIGTEDRVLIKDDEYTKLESLEGLYYKLQKDYLSTFFISSLNSFICKYEVYGEVYNIYNKYLTEFLIRNKLVRDYKDNKSIILRIETFKSRDFSVVYDKSIFRKIENCDKNIVGSNMFMEIIHVANRSSILFNRKERYRDIELCNDNQFNMAYELLESDIIHSFESGVLINDDSTTSVLSNIVTQYLSGSSIDNILLDNLYNKCVIYYDPQIFVLVPFVMYIVNDMISKLSSN